MNEKTTTTQHRSEAITILHISYTKHTFTFGPREGCPDFALDISLENKKNEKPFCDYFIDVVYIVVYS